MEGIVFGGEREVEPSGVPRFNAVPDEVLIEVSA